MPSFRLENMSNMFIKCVYLYIYMYTYYIYTFIYKFMYIYIYICTCRFIGRMDTTIRKHFFGGMAPCITQCFYWARGARWLPFGEKKVRSECSKS